ncbi:MAG TPA: hypothetical protein VMF35_18320 [Acidimicrobiales bacterium]|nr:hypothetical protein [Acidimicrobiales bacterium]
MDRSVWLSRRALKLHAVILVVVPGFLALCIWQITRALGGNTLSWAYVFEWPLFAAYAVYMWWRLVHEDSVESVESVDSPAAAANAATNGAGNGTGADPHPHPHPHTAARTVANEKEQEKEDAELAAYNEYLAQLAEQDKAAGR